MTARDQSSMPLDQLWSDYRSRPCRELREQLFERYRPLAMSVLRRYRRYSDEDLEQVALLGLVKAIDRFDPNRGFQFTSLAVPTILGEVKRYIRDQCRPVRCPRRLFELRNAIQAKEEEMAAADGRPPTLAEVASALGVELEDVAEAMATEDACHPFSLSGLMLSNDFDDPKSLDECLGAEDPELDRAEARIAWEQALETLNPPLQQVIKMRYFQNMSQRQAAERLGVSQMQVSRLERRALHQLRDCAVPA